MVTAANPEKTGHDGGDERPDQRVEDGQAVQAFFASSPGSSRDAASHLAKTKRRLILLGALLVTMIFVVAGVMMATQRAADLAESWRNIDNLAQVLAEQTTRTMQPVDLTLREIQGRLTTRPTDGPDLAVGLSSQATFNLLVERVKSLPQVDSLAVIGPDGRLLNFTRSFPAVPLNVSSRDFFQYFSTTDDHMLFISKPVRSYLDGKWMLFLSRRINDAHGVFAGLIMASVTLSSLEDFYRAVVPKDGAVTVLRRDGLVLVCFPPIESQIGNKMPAEAPWYKHVEQGGGSYLSSGYLRSGAKLVAVRPFREFPLVIDVSTTQEAALAIWPEQMLWLLAGAVSAALCLMFLIWVFGKQYSRVARQNAQLETARHRFDAVLDNMSQGLTFFDSNERLMICNRRYVEIYRLSEDEVLPGTTLSDIIEARIAVGSFVDMTAAAYRKRRTNFVEAAQNFDLTDTLSDGRTVLMRYQPLPTGGWVVTHEEITERRKAEAALTFMAQHDALTELPNRTLFQERLAEAIAMTLRGGHCALLCLDLDRFKVINDTLGHPVGDGLLRAVATRLSNNVRDGDTVARLGGDEFAIIMAGLRSPEDAAKLAERLVLAFNEPYEVDGHRIIAGTSIGISIAPKDANLPDALLKTADIALYLAKAEGRGTFRFFEPDIDAYVQKRRVVELDLRNALPAEDFVLNYQPILDLGSGRVTGFEALIRWHHPIRGVISPAEFIPIAEETGLIIPIGAWVLQKACMEAASWPPHVEIAVNLSPVQFKRGQLLEVVQQALAASNLAPSRLELEITESTLLENSSDRLALLHQLRALGIRIALDDFGTGYSSLSYLRSFPFDKIKIDQSFIRDLDTSKGSAAIVGAIVGLARSLGMTTVAEGVETPQQLAMVREQACAKVQGYLFSRPRLASEVPELIRTLRVPEAGDEHGVSQTSLEQTRQPVASGPLVEGPGTGRHSEIVLTV